VLARVSEVNQQKLLSLLAGWTVAAVQSAEGDN
jgi:hypothetical protein